MLAVGFPRQRCVALLGDWGALLIREVNQQ